MRELRIAPAVSDVLACLLGLESRLITHRRRLPCGSSVLAIARSNGTQDEDSLAVLTRVAHRIAANPRAYDLLQLLAGGWQVRQRLTAVIATLEPAGLTLDVAGGTGILASLSPAACPYVCLDLDPLKLRGFRGKHPHGSALLANATHLPLRSDSVDLALCSSVAHHLPGVLLQRSLAESHRVLRNGGTFILLDPVWEPARWPGRLLWRYDLRSYPRTAAILDQLLSERFYATYQESFDVLHRYLLWVGRKGGVAARCFESRTTPSCSISASCG